MGSSCLLTVKKNDMAKYRHKPIIVEAEQWFPDSPHPDVLYPVVPWDRCPNLTSDEGLFMCNGIDPGEIVHSGDWIVTDKDGFRTLYWAVGFEECYEPV